MRRWEGSQISIPSLRANGSARSAGRTISGSHNSSSCPAKAGHPVRRGLSIRSLAPLEYWVARAMTAEGLARDTASRSRSTFARAFAINFPPSHNQRAQGMPGARCARSRACSVESTRVSHHGHTGNTRHSPRNGLRLISCSPRGPGSLAPVIPEKPASQELSASVGAPGPHDFAVRVRLARQARRRVHRIPLRVRDVAQRPSVGRDQIAIVLIWVWCQSEILKIRNWSERHARNAGRPIP